MSSERFEPFGELIDDPIDAKASSKASRLMTIAGASVFWAMVILIVGARIELFDPNYIESKLASLTSALPNVASLTVR